MHRKGSLLVELLLALLIISLFLPLIYTALLYSSQYAYNYNFIQDEIATIQLRRLFALSYEIHCEKKACDFHYQNKDYKLCFKNESIQLSPGTQIFYDHVENAEFRYEEGLLLIEIKRKDHDETFILSSEEGFNLPTFSDCPNDDLEFESELSESYAETE